MMLKPAFRRVLCADANKLAAHAAWLLRSSRSALAPAPSSQQAISRIISPSCTAVTRQTYATTAKPATRSTTRAASPKKTRAKTTATKKPKKKKTKKVAAKKKKKAPKRVKKPLSPAQQELQRAKTLLNKALLDEPKRLPATAYTVYTTQPRPAGVTSMTQLASAFKSIEPSELERLNHIAVENKEKNQQALRAFVEKHTPEQIRSANRARTNIKKLNVDRKAKGKRSISGSKQKALYKLPDHRPQAKRATTPYIEFSRARWASGDFRNIALPQAASLIAQEYKALSPSDKEAYRK